MKFRKYRIAQDGMACWPQVRIWFKWYRIGKHNVGFGLYPADDYVNSWSFDEAYKIIQEYKKWKKIKHTVKHIEI